MKFHVIAHRQTAFGPTTHTVIESEDENDCFVKLSHSLDYIPKVVSCEPVDAVVVDGSTVPMFHPTGKGNVLDIHA